MMKFPLYLQIIAALILATLVDILLGAGHPIIDKTIIEYLALPFTLIIKALRTLATPLIFLAIMHTFMTAIKTEQIARSQTEYQAIEQIIGLLFDAVILLGQ